MASSAILSDERRDDALCRVKGFVDLLERHNHQLHK